MPEVEISDWTITATELDLQLPFPAHLPATLDDIAVERRKHDRPLNIEDRVDSALFWSGSGKLLGKVAIIAGGSEEIRHAMAMLFSREGADVAIIYAAGEEEGARALVGQVETAGRRALAIGGDIKDAQFCSEAANIVAEEFGKIDVMITSLH
jgi:hypothetical protein